MLKMRIVGLTLLALVACGSAEDPSGPNGGGTGGQGGAAGSGAGSGGAGTGGSTASGAGGSSSGAAGSSSGAAGSSSGAAGEAGSGAAGGAAGSGGVAGSAGSAGTGGEYFVGPNGNDQNPGTRAAPFKTLTKAQAAAVGGNTIWVLPGTHAYNMPVLLVKSGTSGNPIKLYADPGARPLIDFAQQPRGQSAMRGIEIRGDYWHLRGLEVANAADNGVLISGSHNVVEDVVLHHNEDTGLQIMVSEGQATDATRGAHNTVLSCDSYENFDIVTNGENADGFAAKLRIGPGNVFRNCRAWNNVDDGWDLFAADDVVVIENCWAFLNGTTSRGSGADGDGNGFKLGGRPNGVGQGGAVHQVRGNSAFENVTCGFVRNNNPETPSLSQCGVGDNGDDYCDLSCGSDYAVSITAAQAKTARRNADGSLPPTR
jgi:hypothetical protein